MPRKLYAIGAEFSGPKELFAAAEKVRDKGFKDADLKEIGESLPPGSSAIIVIAEDRMVAQLERGLEGYKKIAKHVVSADAAAAIIAEVEEDAPSESAKV